MFSDPWFSKCIELLQRLSHYIDSHGETGILLKPEWVPAFARFGIEVSNGLQASTPPSLPRRQFGPGCWPMQVLPLEEEVQRDRQRGGSRRKGEQARGKLVPPGCRGQDWDLWFAFCMKGTSHDCAPRPSS